MVDGVKQDTVKAEEVKRSTSIEKRSSGGGRRESGERRRSEDDEERRRRRRDERSKETPEEREERRRKRTERAAQEAYLASKTTEETTSSPQDEKVTTPRSALATSRTSSKSEGDRDGRKLSFAPGTQTAKSPLKSLLGGNASKNLSGGNEDMAEQVSDGCSPLHVGAAQGDVVVVRSAALRFDVNVKDMFGCAPLHYAAAKGHDNIVRVLVKVSFQNPSSI
jgi:hypothetical protein